MTVAGTYTVTAKTPMGDQTGTLEVVVTGDSFSGTFSNPMMGSLATENGKVSGDTLTWTMKMTMPLPVTLEGEATVSGDSLSGKLVAGAFGAFALSGTRA